MANNNVTILDYGMCNLLNVARAFEHVGAQVSVTDDPLVSVAADRLVVPGVGAFRDSMKEITLRGFGDAIRRFAESGRPMFGICVGMQILFEASDEFGNHPGLGILPGRVCALPNVDQHGVALRVPHIGWNHLVEPESVRDWHCTMLHSVVGTQPAVYFVHSYAAVPSRQEDRLADCLYGGHRVCAAVQRGLLMASQFHPERSGEVGLLMLRRFLEF